MLKENNIRGYLSHIIPKLFGLLIDKKLLPEAPSYKKQEKANKVVDRQLLETSYGKFIVHSVDVW